MSELPAVLPPPPWRLAPGLRVVRRGRRQLQVGLDPARRVVLPDAPRNRMLLRALLEGDPVTVEPSEPSTRAVLARMHHLRMLRPVGTSPARVAVHAPDWPLDVGGLVDGSGLLRVRSAPDAVLVLTRGEPDRALLDPLVREGTTHLVLALVDGGVRLGPLVRPGRTACLRCVDGHLSTTDPDHVPVLLRYREADLDPCPASGSGLEGVLDHGVDRALVALGTGWAVRDLARHLDGTAPRPATWSSTLTWHPGTDLPVARTWLRHPGCGCGWSDGATTGEDDPSSGTMEA